MTMRKAVCLAVALFCLGAGVRLWAHEEAECLQPKASLELEAAKKLAGTWTGKITEGGMPGEQGKAVSTRFRVTAAGSAVEETLMPGTPHEMVDMYHDESGVLVVTHYCAMGNQPHMILKKATPTELAFEMGPTQGINAAKDVHMHALTLEFPDKDHLTERWVSYKDGKPAETVVFAMTRSS